MWQQNWLELYLTSGGKFIFILQRIDKTAAIAAGLDFSRNVGYFVCINGNFRFHYLYFRCERKCPAFIIYGMQLFVNFMWSIVFFRFKMFGLSVAVILILLGLIIAMIITFRRIRPLAAYLNIPYLLWILFASYLNIGILLLN